MSALFSCSSHCKAALFQKALPSTLNVAGDGDEYCVTSASEVCFLYLHNANRGREQQQVSPNWNRIVCVCNGSFHLVGLWGAAFVHRPPSVTEGSKHKFFHFPREFNRFNLGVYNTTPYCMIYKEHFQSATSGIQYNSCWTILDSISLLLWEMKKLNQVAWNFRINFRLTK